MINHIYLTILELIISRLDTIYYLQLILINSLLLLKEKKNISSFQKTLFSKNFYPKLINQSSNWIDYETQVFEKSINLVKISNDKSYFIGEDTNGKGIVFVNNNKYKGQVKNGQINGCGVLLDESGIRYLGEYENGMRNGFGYCIYSNVDKYQGYWKNDKKHGIGYLYK